MKPLHALPALTLLLLLTTAVVVVHAGVFMDEFTELNTQNWQIKEVSSGRAYRVYIYYNNFLVLYRSENSYVYIDLNNTLLSNAYTDSSILISLGGIFINYTVESPDLPIGQSYTSTTDTALVYVLGSDTTTTISVLVTLNTTMVCTRTTPPQEPWIDYICAVAVQAQVYYSYSSGYYTSYGKETRTLFWGHCYIDREQQYLGRYPVLGTTQIAISLTRQKTTISFTTNALYYYNPYYGETGTGADYRWEARDYSGTASIELPLGAQRLLDFALGGYNYVLSILPSGSTNRYGLSQEVYYDYVIISYTEPTTTTTTPAPTLPTTPAPTPTPTTTPTTPVTSPTPTPTPIEYREVVVFFVIIFALALFVSLLKPKSPIEDAEY